MYGNLDLINGFELTEYIQKSGFIICTLLILILYLLLVLQNNTMLTRQDENRLGYPYQRCMLCSEPEITTV